ncbi:restriction endonuclease subunit S [Bifidobacterium longum]|uniref:Restriction endonuclease subunit S n=1 Tax=Bifidobacterium longum TaxID=216816 RepID=A0AB37LGZ9_BIFLN|nr:restriction endonuclease subunit S [Bifidobacterium longum]
MTEQAKVPAIRFAGFTDPWEQRKLGEIVSIGAGAPPSAFSAGNFLYVKVDDLNESSHFQFDSAQRVDANTAVKPIRKGSIIFAKRGAAILGNKVRVLGKTAYIDTNMMALEPRGVDADFLWLFINQTGLYRIADTSTIPQINNKHIEPYPVDIPNMAEQQAIGTFFSRLDDLITLHQRKYDKLVIFKKSMLEKMFPKDGESVPEIRFAGFTDPWEQRKASEVFQIVDDRGHPTLPVLSATQNQGMIYRDDSGRYIGHDESNEIGYKRVLPGDFVVHLRSFQGGFAHSQYEGITSPAYTVFRAKEPTSHSDRFWKHWFMSEHFIAGLSTVTYGIRDGRSISVDEFMNTFLAFPAVEEQAAISRLFDYLDDLITLHQRKLELLQDIKKSLLDKMFV